MILFFVPNTMNSQIKVKRYYSKHIIEIANIIKTAKDIENAKSEFNIVFCYKFSRF